MKLVAICAVGALAGTLLAISESGAEPFLVASVNASANARDLSISPLLLLATDTDSDSQSGGMATAKARASMDKGDAHALGVAEANAQVGHEILSIVVD
ncbi:MAG: hypothetical protein H0T51_19020 [Pirellulales bacterium]|nr:hypothetical protein [Pirellulales bacterium]